MRRRDVLLVAALLPLSGCGFEPLMARGGQGPVDDLAMVQIGVIENRSGQILRNYLIDAINPTRARAPSQYRLAVGLAEPRQEIAIRRDESASRIAYSAQATFTLFDSRDRPVLTGSTSSTSTYEATISEFASISGQLSARDRALQEISNDIRLQLASYFSRLRAERTSAVSR